MLGALGQAIVANFFLQPGLCCNVIIFVLEMATSSQEISGSDLLSFIFEHNYNLPPAFFAEKTEGQSVLAVGCHSLVHILG